MVYSPEYVVDRLRNAEQAEIIAGDEAYLSDLAQLLDKDAIKEGVEICFGPHKEAFQKAIDALGLNEHLGKDLNVFVGCAATRNAARVLGGKSAGELVRQHGLVPSLDLLQVGRWEVQYHHGMYPFIVPGTGGQKVLTSSLILLDAQPSEEDDRYWERVDTTGLTVMLRAAYQYIPDARDDDNKSLEFAYKLQEIHKQYDSDDITQIGDLLAGSGAELKMPGARYTLKFGRLDYKGLIAGSIHDVETRRGVYVYKSGHIERDSVASGDIYDKALAELTGLV